MKEKQMQSKDIELYFPVAIITCNRINHLRNCIESLSRCTHADQTELFISVDYPPDEKYVDGWNKIKEYLTDVRGFKKANIWFQEVNLGAAYNEHFVYDKVFEQYNAMIFTEDDNIFAPAFLDYMNQMLRRFEKDSKVYSISGFNMLQSPHNSRIFKNYTFQPWGFGIWKDKWNYLRNMKWEEVYEKYSKRIFKIMGLYFQNKWLFCVYVGRLLKEDTNDPKKGLTDATLTLLYYLLGLYSVFPSKSLVKNKGFDGSGANCCIEAVPHIEEVDLDENLLFQYDSTKKVPVSSEWYLPIPEWAQKSSKLNKDPLTYLLYFIMGKEKYFAWRKKKGI